jgi:transposase
MSRKRYPEEFKIEAVKQVTEAGYSAYDVAERPQIVSIVGSGGIAGSC